MTLVLLSVSSAFAQKGQFAAPPEAELGYTQFPIYPKVLTVPQMARLELTASVLKAPTVVFNHYRGLHGKDGRFVLETLPTGTVVLVDKTGVIRYKADCGNRLVELKKSELVAVSQNMTTNGSAPSTTSLSKIERKDLIDWPGLFHKIGTGVFWLLLVMGFIAVLCAIAMLMRGLDILIFGRNANNRAWGGNGGRADTTTHPLAPPATAAATPASTPTAQTPVVPARETERTDGMPSTVYVNMGNASRPHLLTWNGDIRSLSFTRRPNGSRELRVDDGA